MKPNRRDFFQKMGILAGLPFVSSYLLEGSPRESLLLPPMLDKPHLDITKDEDYWYMVRQGFSVSPNIINLNNAGVSPQPIMVQDAITHYNKLSNEGPSYFMWRQLEEGREAVRRELARMGGASHEEIAINRNSTEGLETIIFGLRLSVGDEVVLALQDYPHMLQAWKQRALRDKIVLKFVDISPLPADNTDFLTNLYLAQITEKTKVVHLTHIINWVGLVLPIAHICKKIREINPNIEIIIDGAQSFGQMEVNIPALGGDYFATSLHKWLCAPFGSGMMWVKKEKIGSLFPLLASQEPESQDIRKFEALGTRAFSHEMAIGHAIQFHDAIGIERKYKRLMFLRNYWLEKAIEIPEYFSQSPTKAGFSSVIAGISHKNISTQALSTALFKHAKIHTTAIEWENIKGVRISPNVFTLTRELDVLIETLKKIAVSGQ